MEPTRRRRQPGSHHRILIIDDSATVIRAVKRAFLGLPYEIDTLDHYLEIPRYLQHTPPDLIILDLVIPFLAGERISKYIRRSQQRETPILIYSSLPEETLAATAARMQAAGWVSKGASLDRLVALVDETLT